MKPINLGGHVVYQDRVLVLMRKYYPNPDVTPPSTWTIIDHFWHLDLSKVDALMSDRYSIYSPAPGLPSCMLRSMLLAYYGIIIATRYSSFVFLIVLLVLVCFQIVVQTVDTIDIDNIKGLSVFIAFIIILTQKNSIPSGDYQIICQVFSDHPFSVIKKPILTQDNSSLNIICFII